MGCTRLAGKMVGGKVGAGSIDFNRQQNYVTRKYEAWNIIG